MSLPTPVFALHMEQGANFDHTLQWYGGGKWIGPIEHIEVGYPTIITVTDHLFTDLSPTPVVISGVKGCDHLNSSDTLVALATRITDDTFSVALTSVGEEWEEGTGEITYWRPSDLTSASGEMRIRKNWYSTTIIHTISTALNTMTLGADGSVRCEISAIDTAAMTFVNAVWDIDITISGVITRVFRGTLQNHRDI